MPLTEGFVQAALDLAMQPCENQSISGDYSETKLDTKDWCRKLITELQHNQTQRTASRTQSRKLERF